jgi:hypothetical protein
MELDTDLFETKRGTVHLIANHLGIELLLGSCNENFLKLTQENIIMKKEIAELKRKMGPMERMIASVNPTILLPPNDPNVEVDHISPLSSR